MPINIYARTDAERAVDARRRRDRYAWKKANGMKDTQTMPKGKELDHQVAGGGKLTANNAATTAIRDKISNRKDQPATKGRVAKGSRGPAKGRKSYV